MKIEKRIVRITEVPGVQSIETLDNGHVQIVFTGGYTDTWPTDGLVQLRNALVEVLRAVGAEDNGPWMSLNDVPSWVTRIRDKDGDRLERGRDGTWPLVDANYDRFAPFRADG